MPEAGEDFEAAVAALLARPVEPAADPEAMRTLLELLGRPDRAYPAVRVAGAQGSVARMVAALLSALELKAGCLLTAHVQDVRERVSIAGEPIAQETFAARLRELAPYLAEVDARYPSAVSGDGALAALALAHFADAPADVAVLEAGHRAADPTGLARGEVVVLADRHQDQAAQGAGPPLLPGGVGQDALVVALAGEDGPDESLKQACAEAGARLVTVSESRAVAQRRLAVGGQQLDLLGQTGEFGDVYLPLHGRHQSAGAALALAAVEGFLGFAGGLDPEVIREGFAAVRAPGHLEVVRRPDASSVVLDAARTPAAAEALAVALRDEFSFRHRVMVVAADHDADHQGLLAPLLAVADHVVTTAVAPGEADPYTLAATDSVEADPAELAVAARASGTSAEPAADVATALELASGVAGEEDGVVVVGSAALVGAARRALGLGVG